MQHLGQPRTEKLISFFNLKLKFNKVFCILSTYPIPTAYILVGGEQQQASILSVRR